MIEKARLGLFILVLSLLLGPVLSAQETGEDQLGSWFMYFGTNKITDRLSIHSEAQLRTYELGSNYNQLLLRTGINYHLTDKAVATIGYAWIGTDTSFEEPEGERDLRENRIFQQFILNNSVGKIGFSHRYRLEQRFISRPGAGSVTEHRARYLLRLTYPIAQKFYLTAYDEIFINLQEPLFGQNRLYGAVGFRFNDAVFLEMGFLKNHFSDRNYDRLQLGIWWNTDLRKKPKGS